MKALLTRFLGLRPKLDATHLTFTIYSREGCDCCVTALELLAESQKRHGFGIEIINVDADPQFAEKYGLSVPVVFLNGKERFKGKVNPALLDRLLLAESRSD